MEDLLAPILTAAEGERNQQKLRALSHALALHTRDPNAASLLARIQPGLASPFPECLLSYRPAGRPSGTAGAGRRSPLLKVRGP